MVCSRQCVVSRGFCCAVGTLGRNPCEHSDEFKLVFAICGAGTTGQMEDKVRVAQSFKPFSQDELADVRERAVVGQGVYTGTMMEYWKMQTARG
jgi:hypothetical protein